MADASYVERKIMNLKIGVFAIVAGLVGAVLFSQSQRPATMPELNGAVGWLNSGPLTAKSLRGKVVLVNFWTYTCINSLRPMPYVKSWAAKYNDAGLVVIGVHTPEFRLSMNVPTSSGPRGLLILVSRSPSTATTTSGSRFMTKRGRRNTSWMAKERFATGTMARANTSRWSASSRDC
jgi:thiol-disulfide isomerase/thioredoxin